MRLIFSFDTEEYETPGVDDAVRIWAEMLTRHGLRGVFCLVGEKARVLRRRGRKDVLDALAPHEIGFHSNFHSRHPLHAEYLEEMGWEEGVLRVIREELPGICDVEEICGRRPFAYCKPGGSWGAQVAWAMAQMGLPVFSDAPFEQAPGRPLWYCNQLFVEYHFSFDAYFDVADRPARMKADFARLCEEIGDGVGVLYTHPVRLFTQRFTDNFRYGRNTPPSQWETAPLRPRARIEELIRDFEAFVEFIAGEGIEVIGYRELYERYRRNRRWVDLRTVLRLARAVREELNFHRIDGNFYAPAEIFGLFAFALERYRRTGSLPGEIPLRAPAGPDRLLRFEEDPAPVSVEEILFRAGEADRFLDEQRRMPASVVCGRSAVAPGGFLQVMGELIRKIDEKEIPSGKMKIDGRRVWPALALREDLARMEFGWSMFHPGFEGRRVAETARLQTWTAKPAEER